MKHWSYGKSLPAFAANLEMGIFKRQSLADQVQVAVCYLSCHEMNKGDKGRQTLGLSADDPMVNKCDQSLPEAKSSKCKSLPCVLHCALVSPNYAEATSCNMQCHYTQMTRNHAIATMSIEIPAQFASQVPQVWKWKLVSENCWICCMLNPPHYLGWAHKIPVLFWISKWIPNASNLIQSSTGTH